MKALILRKDPHAAVATAHALTEKGFQILSVDTLAVAHALIRIDAIDLLVLDEEVEGQLTHAIALSAERRNPYLSAIFLTDRAQDITDDLYDLIPSLYALVGCDAAPELLGQLALSSAHSLEDASARVAQNKEDDLAEVADAADVLILEASDCQTREDGTEIIEPGYADVAIATPELAEIAAIEQEVTMERVEDVVMAEVAALFRDHPLPFMLQGDAWITAEAS